MAFRVADIDFGAPDIPMLDVDEEENEEQVHLHVERRYLRDAANPLESFTDVEFRGRFRFSKESVLHGFLPKIKESLQKPDNRGLPISPLWQLLICLRFYATASFQVVLADLAGISQPTVSRIIERVTILFAGLLWDTIKMPQGAEARLQNRRLFQELGHGQAAIGLPGIDGAIDCTHIRLMGTCGNVLNENFRNRKGYFSLNVQAVVGPRTEFLDIVPEYAGSVHDSRIFRNSRLYMRYVEQEIDGMLVGDAGYPALPFLLTPIANPRTEEHVAYNAVHTRTRIIVERTFGIWKRRFPCLQRGIGTKLETTAAIVVACAVLHNLSLTFNDVLEEEEPQDEEEPVPLAPAHY